MSCELCTSSPKAKDENRSNIEAAAKKQAMEQHTPMAIFQDEEGQWTYIPAAIAFTAGLVVRNVVSQFA